MSATIIREQNFFTDQWRAYKSLEQNIQGLRNNQWSLEKVIHTVYHLSQEDKNIVFEIAGQIKYQQKQKLRTTSCLSVSYQEMGKAAIRKDLHNAVTPLLTLFLEKIHKISMEITPQASI